MADTLEFCDECGSMMRTEDEDDVALWVCSSCGHEEPKDPEKAYVVTTESQEESEVVDISDAEDRGLPTTSAACPNCDNDRAYYYMQQIRAADESETRFFVCTECEHKWREDDH